MSRVAATLALTASLLLLLGSGCGAPARDDRLNVLLVIVDTLRADHLGAYGSRIGATPAIDRFAADSVVFERAIASSASTVPSHASIMTSRYVREVAAGFATGEGKLEDRETLAAALREAGYATAAFVGNAMLKRRWGFSRGFDVYDDDLPESELNRNTSERLAEDTTERAIAWMAATGDRPFFLWVHYQDPHGPYSPPAAHRGQISSPPKPGESPLRVLTGRDGLGGIPAHQVVPGLRLPSAYRDAYGDEILYADRWVGELIEAFDAQSTGRETVVLLTSDHGESLGEGSRYFVHGHTTTPQIAHVPLILRAPGLAPGRRADFVSHVDVMPTLLSLAGVELNARLRGLPLGRFLREGRPLPDRYVFCDIGKEVAAYRGQGFLRAVDIPALREPGSDAEKSRRRVSWARYAWPGRGSWKRTQNSVPPERVLTEYLESGVPFTQVELDPATRDRLHSLGYLDD